MFFMIAYIQIYKLESVKAPIKILMKSKEGLKYLDTVGCGKVQHFRSFQLPVFRYSAIPLFRIPQFT